MPQVLYVWVRRLQHPLQRNMHGLQSWSAQHGQEKNFMPLLGIEPQFFGHPTICLIMHGALLAPFIVQYGLHIFDIKFCNLNAAQAYAAVNGRNKICCAFVSAGQWCKRILGGVVAYWPTIDGSLYSRHFKALYLICLQMEQKGECIILWNILFAFFLLLRTNWGWCQINCKTEEINKLSIALVLYNH